MDVSQSPLKAVITALSLGFASVTALTATGFHPEAQAQAQQAHPATKTVQDAIAAFKGRYNGSNTASALRASILPHFDMRSIAAGTVGPEWRSASEDQKDRFTQEFTDMVLREYGRKMADMARGKVEFRTPRAVGDGSPPKVALGMEISGAGGAPVSMEYSMYQAGNGSWRINGVRIEGISLTQHFRSQFSAVLEKGGLEGLIGHLAKGNGRAGAALAMPGADIG